MTSWRSALGAPTIAALLAMSALACNGHGGGGGGGGALAAGTWSGTWTSGRGPSGTFSAQLDQSGSALDGTLTLAGSPCLTIGEVHGNALRNDVVMTAEAGGMAITLEGLVIDDDMSGTYRALGGACDGDIGSFIASR